MQIKIKDLSKKIKGNIILKDINLTFNSGNIYGIVGKNGSGKTMLLRAISGLIVPSKGEILIDNKKLHKDLSFPPDMGILIEKPEFLSYMTGLENLCVLADIKKQTTKEHISDLMSWFDLDPKSKKSVRKYSQGMKQKLGIIQAIMEEQKLLILDEAFNALDEQTVHKLRELLIDYKEQGKLIIITSHNKEDIEQLCDEVYKIENGSIVEQVL